MNCLQCPMQAGSKCRAAEVAEAELRRTLPPPPLGSCMLPIVDGYLTYIQPGMRVLDIGCGSWARIRNHCEKVGAVYEGIDVAESYFGVPTVATRLENLADLSYPDNSFDMVVSNQSMEHWGEFGCSLRWGLYQCFRVSKIGARLCFNVPIFFHGTSDFMLGRLGRILQRCWHFTDDVRLERWGQPSGEIPPNFPFPGYWRQSRTPAYILDIQMIKTRETAPEKRPLFNATGRAAQVLHYPFSFNLYRVLNKLKLIRSN